MNGRDEDRPDRTETRSDAERPANAAPDAVMDPNEKTEGKPGLGPQGGRTQHDEVDPGGS